jgi:hypothetical protein
MSTKPFTVAVGAVGLVLSLACSGDGGMGGPPGDDRLFVPADLPANTTDTTGGWLTLVAFTLVQEALAPALYVAVRNDGESPACNVGMMIDFLDKDGYTVTSAGAAVWSKQYYRLDPNVIFSCIDPGQVGMAAVTNLPSDLVIAELGSLRHSFPGFILQDIVPVQGLTVSGVRTTEAGPFTAYTGTFTNRFDAAVSAPAVAVFPVNRVGRPLGMGTCSVDIDLAPGGSVGFETSPVDETGAGYEAYPAGSPAY